MRTQATPTKRCKRCGETKPVTEFYRNRNSKDGYYLYCIDCKKQYLSERNPRPEKPTSKEEHYQKLIQQQIGCCLICGGVDDGRRLAVDHCHETGELRALLCSRCNIGLGYFRDNPLLLRAAALYLEAHIK